MADGGISPIGGNTQAEGSDKEIEKCPDVLQDVDQCVGKTCEEVNDIITAQAARKA
jgi:hypothetical protein